MNPKDLIGSNKPPLHLCPLSASIHQSLAHEDGSKKYGLYNWRSGPPVSVTAYIRACESHIKLFYDCGETYAKDSLIHHLGHAIASLAILIDAMEMGHFIDDRPTPSGASALMDRITEERQSHGMARSTPEQRLRLFASGPVRREDKHGDEHHEDGPPSKDDIEDGNRYLQGMFETEPPEEQFVFSQDPKDYF